MAEKQGKVCSNIDCTHKGFPQDYSRFTKSEDEPDGYRPLCKTCVRNEKREVRPQHEQVNALVKAAGATTALSQGSNFSELAAAFMSVYGDPRRFAQEFVTTARLSKPGIKLRAMVSLINMFKEEQDRSDDPTQDLGLLDKEEIDERIRRIMLEIQNEGAIEVDFSVDIDPDEVESEEDDE